MRPFRIVLFVAGIFVAMLALGFVAGGLVLMWANATQRDADGYFTTGPHDYATSTYALTSTKVDLGADPGWAIDIGTVRITAIETQGKDVFVGIGPQSAVDGYLADVEHSVVTDLRLSPFSVTTSEVAGTSAPTPPAGQGFWEAEAIGPGTQTLTWDLRSGTWAVVVMNADGSAGVNVRMSIGAKTDILLPIGIGILVLGVLFVAGAAVLLIIGRPSTWQRQPSPASAPTPAPPSSGPPPPPPAMPPPPDVPTG